MSQIFDHEHHDARSLTRMPLCVRRKLLDIGRAPDADFWTALPIPARRRLVDIQVESPIERRVFAALVHWMSETFRGPNAIGPHGSSAVPSHPDNAQPWHAPTPPEALGFTLESSGLRWDALDTDARFALFEAAREGPEAIARAAQSVVRGRQR